MLYSSPFLRALQTAQAIGGVLGLEPVVIDDLREQDFGVYRGRPYTDFYGHWMAAGGVERWDLRPEGGEMLREVARRAGAALDLIARQHLGGEVVVVSHGGVMSALRGWVLDDYTQPPVATVSGDVTTFDDAFALKGATYYYQVAAVNDLGETRSTEKSGVSASPYVAPPRGAPGATPAPVHNGPAFWFKISAQQDGSFTVTNTRNSFSKTYRARQ